MCVVQWRVLINLPRRAHLAQARITGTRSGFLLERSPRREAVFLSDELSRPGETASPKREFAKPSREIGVVSPKRESAA